MREALDARVEAGYAHPTGNRVVAGWLSRHVIPPQATHSLGLKTAARAPGMLLCCPDRPRTHRGYQQAWQPQVVPGGHVRAAGWPDCARPYSLRWVLVHMLEEYAQHNGHADLIRESIDGSTRF